MFINCPHCRALVATDPATDLPPPRCPRCAAQLRDDSLSPDRETSVRARDGVDRERSSLAQARIPPTPTGAEDGTGGPAAGRDTMAHDVIGQGNVAGTGDVAPTPGPQTPELPTLPSPAAGNTPETAMVASTPRPSGGGFTLARLLRRSEPATVAAAAAAPDAASSTPRHAPAADVRGIAETRVYVVVPMADRPRANAPVPDPAATVTAIRAAMPRGPAHANAVAETGTDTGTDSEIATDTETATETDAETDTHDASVRVAADADEGSATVASARSPVTAAALAREIPSFPSAASTVMRHSPSFVRSRAAAPPASRRQQWGLAAAIAGLSVLLALQWVVADREQLAADARWRPLVQRVCGVLGCLVPAWREPDALVLLDRDVRPDPEIRDALRVSASFRNDAPWPQAWPRLQLTLSDVDGIVVAERTFAADDYLGAAPSQPLLAPGQIATVRMLVAEPTPRSVAFAFAFR